MLQPVAAETRSSLISGVLPIASTIPLLNCIAAISRKSAYPKRAPTLND
jgi:hypothetical protein